MTKWDVNNNHKYNSDDITKILELRIRQEGLRDTQADNQGPAIYTIAAISNLDYDALRRELTQELGIENRPAERVILIPFNLGGYHWVGLNIHRFEGRGTKIRYYDSLEENINGETATILRKVYGENTAISSGRNYLKQEDYTSCGPMTVENLIASVAPEPISERTPEYIRALHIGLMERHCPTERFHDRQLNDNANNKEKLEAIAKDYLKRNIAPYNLSKQELLSYIIGAIKEAQEAHKFPDEQATKTYLNALSALSRALQISNDPFIKKNPGIPWDALSQLVRYVNIEREPFHGIGGHKVAPNDSSFMQLDLRKKLIKEIVNDLAELESSFKSLEEFNFFQQRVPVANTIRSINHYFAKDIGTQLLKKIAEMCSNLELGSTSENRVLYLRQIALVGEVFTSQFPDYLKKFFNEELVNFCKSIRTSISHFETEYVNSQNGDKERGEEVKWLKEYISERHSFDNRVPKFAKKRSPDTPDTPDNYFINNPRKLSGYIKEGLEKIPDSEKEVKLDLESGFRHIEEVSLSYGDDFLEEVSGNSETATQVQLLYLLQRKQKSIGEKYKKIETKLLSYKQQQIGRNEYENRGTGKLNTVALKGGKENFENIKEILQYLYLFQKHFNNLKKASDLDEYEKKFLKQYESVLKSCLAKIEQILEATTLKDKQTYLSDFCKLFSGKFKTIREEIAYEQIRKLFGSEVKEEIIDLDSKFYILYEEALKANEELSSRLNQETSCRRPKNGDAADKAEKLISEKLISAIIDTMPDLLKYFKETNNLRNSMNDYSIDVPKTIELSQLKHPLHNKKASFTPIFNPKDAFNLGLLNKYDTGRILLKNISGDDRFILRKNKLVGYIFGTEEVRDFTRFFKSLVQDIREEAIGIIERLKENDKKLLTPDREVKFCVGGVEPKASPVFTEKLGTSTNNREFYQLIIGAYARALLENDLFLGYISEGLHSTLHKLRAGRGYLGHNTEPNLGMGKIDGNTHSSDIAHTLIEDLLYVLPELLVVRLKLTDDFDKFKSDFKHLYSELPVIGISDNKVKHVWENLKDQVDSTPEPSSLTQIPTILNTDQQLWYDDQNIRNVLERELNEENRYTITPITVFDNEENLRTNIESALRAVINGEEGHTAVMYINLRSNHWVGAVFRMQEGNLQVIFNDPLGNPIELEPNAVAFVRAIVEIYPNANILDLRHRQQENGNDCGAFTTENLIKIAQMDNLATTREDIIGRLPQVGDGDSLRERHAEMDTNIPLPRVGPAQPSEPMNYVIGHFDNPILNDQSIAKLFKIAKAHFGMEGVNKLIELGYLPEQYQNFQNLREEIGDEAATKLLLEQELQDNIITAGSLTDSNQLNFNEKLANQMEYSNREGVIFETLRHQLNLNEEDTQKHNSGAGSHIIQHLTKFGSCMLLGQLYEEKAGLTGVHKSLCFAQLFKDFVSDIGWDNE